MPKTVIGIDLGGTKIHGVLMNEKNEILEEVKVLTEAKKGLKAVLEKLYHMAEVLKRKDTKAIGIAVAGPMDYEAGIVYEGPNLPGWKNVPLKKHFEKKLGIPTFIENDAKCFALAEYHLGAGKGSEYMVGITLGTGIGSGIVLHGDLYRGRDNIAGELGHMTIDYNGHKCHCGNHGCLERYASGTAIAERTLRHLKKKDYKTDLTKADLTARKIYAAALDGDPLASHIMEDTGKYFGIGIANIVNVLNPDKIVLGGSASRSFPVFKKRMFTEIKERAFHPGSTLKVVRQRLSAPGPIGAALIARAGMAKK